MGTFLSLSGIVGKTKSEVVASLTNYAIAAGGGLKKGNLSMDNDNRCIIEEANGNTTIFNPYGYLEWDQTSGFISKELNAPVFSFHIHDGDLWMYVLFVNGEIADQFNPIPDYWDGDISKEEMNSWKGNAAIVAKNCRNILQADIENYLVRWDPETDDDKKAYQDDEYTREDWQLLDFMKKLQLPYPIDDEDNPVGDVYQLWTKELPLKLQIPNKTPKASKPWWKRW